VCLLAAALLVASAGAGSRALADIPARLSSQEFWALSQKLSEPDGMFRSDNVLSNEMVFARLVPELVSKIKPGGIYLGVGPEQNFTYLVAMQAKLAFIMDIRRENLHLHLMYKALFELSADRAEFVSRLFTKPRPAGLTKASSIDQIMDAYWATPTADEPAYAANLEAIQKHLTGARGLPLPQADLDGIATVYRAFYVYGPAMDYSARLSLTPLTGRNAATYYDLMTQKSDQGEALSYLGTEARFAYIKDLEARNLIVPLVGDFAGPKAIRGVGDYVRSRGETLSAFYVSTVEPYLKRAGVFETYCASVATLPMRDDSVFIRPGNLQNLAASGAPVAPPPAGTLRLGTYQIGVVVPMKTGCY
jgi:hypothetical protein